MIIHTCNDRTPYTYLIGWSILNKWYYGVRYGKDCNPNDLWNPYKTSSKYVKEFIKEHGEPDIIEVSKIFYSIKSALKYESVVIRRMKCVRSVNWLNKGNFGKEYCPDCKRRYGIDNVSKRPEVRKKISDSKIGKKATWQLGENNPAKRPEVREKISVGLKEYKFQGWVTNGIKNNLLKAKTEEEFIKKVNEFEFLGYTKGRIDAFKR